MPTTPVSPQDAGVAVSAGGQTAARLRFPALARVRAKAEFSAVFSSGKRCADPRLALHWLHDGMPARMGLAVSRKVDRRAVGRNRIKRALRDAFRRLRPSLRGGAYVVVARPAAASCDTAALQAALMQLLQRAGALPARGVAGTMPPARTDPRPPSPSPLATGHGRREPVAR